MQRAVPTIIKKSLIATEYRVYYYYRGVMAESALPRRSHVSPREPLRCFGPLPFIFFLSFLTLLSHIIYFSLTINPSKAVYSRPWSLSSTLARTRSSRSKGKNNKQPASY